MACFMEKNTGNFSSRPVGGTSGKCPDAFGNFVTCPDHILGILAHLLGMVMEPKYYGEEIIGHPNHHLRI